ncbi:hypothetical protein EXIGLDRAFT_332602 [Exidia glandulosa HHB12029]|uniref:Uncharacterized protein n=1 Tax=Exidia glandulosa HHB12029 TaxID=1314781 RepID=A0A165LLG8_EXIGL|nr:hypothetical protein EXIGLDRAFT_332602 [Exidia glandulosa HHB12029]
MYRVPPQQFTPEPPRAMSPSSGTCVLLTPGNVLTVTFLSLGVVGTVCGNEDHDWCPEGAGTSFGVISLIGAGVITLLDRNVGREDDRSWSGRLQLLKRCAIHGRLRSRTHSQCQLMGSNNAVHTNAVYTHSASLS